MTRVTTLRAVVLPVGSVLGLSKAQASARAHQLVPAPKGKGQFVAQTLLQFKAGETFDLAGPMPKELADALAVEGSSKPARAVVAPPAPDAAADAVHTSAPADSAPQQQAEAQAQAEAAA